MSAAQAAAPPRALAWTVALGWACLEPIVGPSPGLVRRRGRWLVDAGETELAILYLHRHLEAWPDDPWLHFHAGRAAQLKGLNHEARVRFAHAAALAPAEATFRFALGYALRQAGHLPAAAAEYRRALDHSPEDPRILFNLGIVEREQGALAVAQGCFEQVCARWRRDARAHYTLGVCAYERNDLDRSLDALERAVRLDRRHHKSWYQLGLVHLERDRGPQAREALRQALRLQPSYAPAHYALGRSLIAEEPAAAARHLREAILGHPPVRRAHLDLGRLHEKAGHLDRARAEYALYQRHHPDKHQQFIAERLAALTERP